MDRLYKREKYLNKIRPYYDDTQTVKIITGVRGCGKTSLLELIIDELIKSSVKEENIIKINLDKRPYKGVTTAKQLIDIIRDKTKGADGIKYVFIDEIHNVAEYETVLNVCCKNNELSAFITSSNGYILQTKHLARLTFRYAYFEIHTLTFDEYLEMKRFYGNKVSDNIDEEFARYLMDGAFPYIVQNDIGDGQKKYAKEILNEIYDKDVRKHKRIKNPEVFEAIEHYIINNYGKPISIKNMQESLGEKFGKTIRKELLYNYLGILEDARIVYKCSRFDMDNKKILNGKEKYYLSDISFYFAIDIYNTLEREQALENIVFIYAISNDYAAATCKIGRKTVDFIMQNTEMDYIYVQVTDYLDNGEVLDTGRTDREEAEYKPLEKIRDSYPKYVLTLDKVMRKRNGIKQWNMINHMRYGKKF